jgi:CRISPR/Cas system CSM-associated protein Csm3 (group 7 of RAMP superfamily)
MARVDFIGTITTVTPFCFSTASTPKSGSTLMLPKNHKGLVDIPTGTIKGSLRHRGWQAVHRKVAQQRNIRFTQEEHYFNVLGGVKQGNPSDFQLLRDRPRYEDHPFVGLWGCMQPVNLRGKIQVEAAEALQPFTCEQISRVRSDPIQRGELRPSDFPPGEFEAYLELLSGNREKRKARDDKTAPANGEPRAMSANLPFAFEAVPAGIPFSHHIILDRQSTESQLGLLLASFEEFSDSALLGAQRQQNCGLVNMEYEVLIDRQAVGTMEIMGRSGTFKLSNSLRQYLNAFWNAFPQMDFGIPS